MPAWSHEVANEMIELARAQGKAFTQMHLQELVYIAHGWCLASTGQPLTGDRPEAMVFGPEYRRMADAFAPYGTAPITKPVKGIARADLDPEEQALLADIQQQYGDLKTVQLATLTRGEETPWRDVFSGGAGEGREISHNAIAAQFDELARQSHERSNAS